MARAARAGLCPEPDRESRDRELALAPAASWRLSAVCLCLYPKYVRVLLSFLVYCCCSPGTRSTAHAPFIHHIGRCDLPLAPLYDSTCDGPASASPVTRRVASCSASQTAAHPPALPRPRPSASTLPCPAILPSHPTSLLLRLPSRAPPSATRLRVRAAFSRSPRLFRRAPLAS